jgi:hypothetical protein
MSTAVPGDSHWLALSVSEWATIDAALDNARAESDAAGDLLGARGWQDARDLLSRRGIEPPGPGLVKVDSLQMSRLRSALGRELELARVLGDTMSISRLESALKRCS